MTTNSNPRQRAAVHASRRRALAVLATNAAGAVVIVAHVPHSVLGPLAVVGWAILLGAIWAQLVRWDTAMLLWDYAQRRGWCDASMGDPYPCGHSLPCPIHTHD